GVTVVFLSVILLFPAIRDRLPGPLKSGNSTTSASQPAAPTAAPSTPMPSVSAENAGLDPFTALHFVPIDDYSDSVSVAHFDAKGNLSSRIVPVICEKSNPPTRIAIDPQDRVIYAISAHEYGVIDATSGKFTVFPMDPNLPKLSWPGGIAF